MIAGVILLSLGLNPTEGQPDFTARNTDDDVEGHRFAAVRSPEATDEKKADDGNCPGAPRPQKRTPGRSAPSRRTLASLRIVGYVRVAQRTYSGSSYARPAATP